MDDARIDDQEDDHRDDSRNGEPLDALPGRPVVAVCLLEEDDERDEEQRQDVEQVDANGETEEVRDGHEVAVGVQTKRVLTARGEGRLLRPCRVPPDEREPDHECCEQHGHGVDLGLDGVEPERVRRRKRERSDHTSGIGANPLCRGPCRRMSGPHADETPNHQVGQHDGQRATEDRDQVDRVRDGLGTQPAEHGSNHREQPPDQHVKRCAGRVTHLESVRDGDKLARVPERRRLGHGGPIEDERVEKNRGGDEAVEKLAVHAWRGGTSSRDKKQQREDSPRQWRASDCANGDGLRFGCGLEVGRRKENE